MFWEMNFHFQLLYVHVLTCCRKKLGGKVRVPPALPYATAPNKSRIRLMTWLPVQMLTTELQAS